MTFKRKWRRGLPGIALTSAAVTASSACPRHETQGRYLRPPATWRCGRDGAGTGRDPRQGHSMEKMVAGGEGERRQ